MRNPWDTAPTGWLPCNGQLLRIAAPYTQLYALLGTTYGGDGKTTFAVPDLQARMPLSSGQGPGLSSRVQGDNGGWPSITLLRSELAPHNHTANADSNNGEEASPQNAVWGVQNRGSEAAYYAGPSNTAMNPESIGLTGDDQPHNNLPPYLVLNFCIAYEGEFPSYP